METNSGSVFRPLSFLLICLVLASRTCTGSPRGSSRNERDGGRGFSRSLFSNLEDSTRTTHDGAGSEMIQGPRLYTGKMLKSMSMYFNEEVSGCNVSETVKASYNESTQAWTVDASILKEVKNDIQSIVECAKDGDKIHLFFNKEIKLPRTIVIDKNILLGSVSGKRASTKNPPSKLSPSVRLQCPDSGELIVAKSPSFTLINVLLKNCNGPSVIKVVPDCEEQQELGVVALQNLKFEKIAVNETSKVIEADLASCSQLTMENVYLHAVDCGTRSCITLPPYSSLKKVELVDNKGDTDSSIFSAEAQATVSAESITATKNKVRIMSLSNSSLTLLGSHFIGNGKTRPCVDCTERCTGGAIIRAEHSTLNITDCEFLSSRGREGGSLCINFSKLDILNSSFRNNTTGKDGNGGAVHVFQSPSVTITRTQFMRNKGSLGAALFSNGTSLMNLIRVKFWNNNSTNEGAAYLIGGEVNSKKVHFDHNKRRALVTRNVSMDVYNSTFEDNHATHGSACAILDGSVFIADMIHVSNNSANKLGGGAFEVAHSQMQITGSQFVNNFAHLHGGAIQVHHGALSLKNTRFSKNNAGENGGAINLISSSFEATKTTFKRNHGGELGGAVFVREPTALSIKKTHFLTNTGYYGGAMYVVNTGKIDSDLYGLSSTHVTRNVRCVSGGKVLESQSPPCLSSSSNSASEDSSLDQERHHAAIVECTFEDNKAEADGGAMFLMKASGLVLSGITFENNEGVSGGAISMNSSRKVLVEGCEFSTNTVTSLGGSIYASSSDLNVSQSEFKKAISEESGGALYLKTTTGTMLDTIIQSNEARDQCGGICVANRSSLKADGLTLLSNTAGNEGGGLLVHSDSTFLCYQCTIKKNEAIGGAGMFVLSGNKRLVAAQLQDSIFKSNVARDYGGGMVLASLNGPHLFFQRNNVKHGNVVLLNTDFLNNKADVSGSAIMSPTLDKVLLSCNETTSKRDFVKQDELETLKPLDGNRPCSSWNGNILANDTSGKGAITTSPDEPTESKKWPPSPEPIPQPSPTATPEHPATAEPEPSPAPEPSVSQAPEPSVSQTPEPPLSSEPPEPPLSSAPPEPSVFQVPEPSVSQVPATPQSEIGPSTAEGPEATGSEMPLLRRNKTSSSPSPQLGNYYLALSVDPDSGVEIITDNKSGFILLNAKSGTILPTIHVTVQSVENALLPASSEDMSVVVESPDGYIPGNIIVHVMAGHGDTPRIAGFVRPGNYTLLFIPQGTSKDGGNVNRAVMTIVIGRCEIGEAFDEENIVCQKCDAGSYNFDPNGPGRCSPCPEKATCEGRYIVPNKGKWHKTPCHGHMKDCIHELACSYDNRQQKLTSFTRNVADCSFNESMVETYGEEQCSKGYSGRLCGSCKDSHGLSSSFRCFKCPQKTLSILLIVALICYLAAIVVLVAEGYVPFEATGVVEQPPTEDVPAIVIEATTERGPSILNLGAPAEEDEQEALDEVPKNPEDRLKVEIARIRVTENLKILFNFLQTISLAALINVRWTSGMIGMFRFTDHVSAASLGAVYWPLSCVFSSSSAGGRAVRRMVLSLIVPVFAIVVAIVLWRRFTRKAKQGSLSTRIKLGVVVVTYISYIALAKVAIGAFYCVDVNDSLDPASNSESKYWALDTSMKCMKGSHSTVVGLAIVGLILITVCFPIISSLAALAHANDASAESSAWIFGPLSFLYTAFKKELVLWEGLAMIRKVVLVVIVVFAYPLGGQAQGILAFIVLISTHYFQTVYRPYRNEIDSLNDYESRSLLICSLVFALSLFFNIKKCSQVVRCCATILIVALILAFIIFLLYMFVKNVFEAIKAILQYGGFYVSEGTSALSVLDMYLCSNVFHTY